MLSNFTLGCFTGRADDTNTIVFGATCSDDNNITILDQHDKSEMIKKTTGNCSINATTRSVDQLFQVTQILYV